MKPDLRDLLYFGGLVLASGGCASIYWPAGLIVLGAGLMWPGRPRRTDHGHSR